MNRFNFALALGALSLPALLAFSSARAEEGGACNVEAAPTAEGQTAKAAPKDREHVDADGVVRRGASLSKEGELVTVSAAVKRGKELDGKKVKLQGKVSDVCTKAGCWFVVQGEKTDDKIRISTKSHSIFVPMKAVGYTATVEGTLTVRTITKETAQHYEDERTLKAGEKHKVITGDVQEIFIDVAGLEMKKS